MALPPRRDNESFPEYIYRMVTPPNNLDPAVADRVLQVYRQPDSANQPLTAQPQAPDPANRGQGGGPSVRLQRFFDALTPEERQQIGAEMYGEEFGYASPLVGSGEFSPTASDRLIDSDQFTSGRSVNRFHQDTPEYRRYRNAVGNPFPHHQRIPDPQPRSTPATPPPPPDNRSVEEVLADRESTPLSIPAGGFPPRPPRGPGPSQPRYELKTEEEKLQHREAVRNELARRSIARRIRRGADPRKLIDRHNVGGVARGRYLDPAEFGYRRPGAAAAADGSIVESDSGNRRVQTDSEGVRAEVPVFETFQGEHVIDPSGLSEEEFNEFYTPGDRQRTAELIYAMDSDLSSRQRSIDAARNAAALDDYLSPEDRESAMEQIGADEARLHRQFLISNAALVSNRNVIRDDVKDEDKPDAPPPITQRELLDFVNGLREAAGEEPFEEFRDLRETLRPSEIRNYLEALKRRQGEEDTPVDLGMDGTYVPPIIPDAGRDPGTIFDQFMSYLLDPMFGGSDFTKSEKRKILRKYFDDSGRVFGPDRRPEAFRELVRQFEQFMIDRGAVPQDIPPLVESMVESLERSYRQHEDLFDLTIQEPEGETT